MADLQNPSANPMSSEGIFPDDMRETMRDLAAELLNAPPGGNQLSRSDASKVVGDLPRLSEEDIARLGHHDSLCPICFTPLMAILAEEEMALAMESPAHSIDDLGVTRLHNTCGHLFCRRDISKWIRDAHDSCPTCRRLLINSTSSDSDNPVDAPEGHPTALNDLLSALQQQLEARTSVNPTRPEDFFAAMSAGLPEETERDAYEERAEYTGMYS